MYDEKFEDTKGVTRNHKDKQYKGQKIKGQTNKQWYKKQHTEN